MSGIERGCGVGEEPNEQPEGLAELAASIAVALLRADQMGLAEVAIALDTALNRLAALDPTGAIQLVPFALDEG